MFASSSRLTLINFYPVECQRSLTFSTGRDQSNRRSSRTCLSFLDKDYVFFPDLFLSTTGLFTPRCTLFLSQNISFDLPWPKTEYTLSFFSFLNPSGASRSTKNFPPSCWHKVSLPPLFKKLAAPHPFPSVLNSWKIASIFSCCLKRFRPSAIGFS